MKRNCFLCTMFRLKGKLMGPEDLINRGVMWVSAEDALKLRICLT